MRAAFEAETMVAGVTVGKKRGVKRRSKGRRKAKIGRGERMTMQKEIEEKCEKAEWIAWRGGQKWRGVEQWSWVVCPYR
jgi:hypothetical protein